MVRVVLGIGLLVQVACGGGGGDPGVDAPSGPPDAMPPDPFAGMYDDPSDFPRGGCTPGSIEGFAHVELWPPLALRTTVTGGALQTYVSEFLGEVLVPHLLTPDDLFVRHSTYNGRWQLRATDICGVDADGTVHGTRAWCYERPPDSPLEPCDVVEFHEPPFRWIAGETVGEHLTLLGEVGRAWPRTASNVRVDGDYAFLSTFDDGLRVVSIANPAAPVEVGHFILPDEFANDLKILHAAGLRVAVTASYTTNVIDVSNPSAPALLAQIPFSAHSVFVEGTTAYLVDGSSSAVEVWSLAQPQAPVQLAAWSHPDNQRGWHDIYVAGGIAYLSDMWGGTGLNVVDFRTPQAPVVLGAEPGLDFSMWHSPWLTSIGGRPVAINGTEFIGPGFRLLDGDPASPTFLATLGEWSLGAGSAHNLMAIGPRIYMAHYRHGVRVLDASDPANVVQLGYFNTWLVGEGGAGDMGTFGIDLDPARRRIYAADATRGLLILEGDTTVFP
jgi:hypothetical protein